MARRSNTAKEQARSAPKWAFFGAALTDWWQRSERKRDQQGQEAQEESTFRKELAKAAQVELSALYHWRAGRKRPDQLCLVHLLRFLHDHLKDEWSVAEVLDGITPLGYTWDDVYDTLENELQSDSGQQSFQAWWVQGKPQPLPPPRPGLPTLYVERAELKELRSLVTQWDTWREAHWKAILMTGIAGIGKTTLLAGLAQDPAILRHFRDGILWLDGAKRNLLEQAAYQVGLKGPSAARRQEWARWASHPDRRLLVVVDDALPDEELDGLLVGAGPQVVFVITTQQEPEVRAVLERWFPRDRIHQIIVRGMREEEGFALIEQVQQRPIAEQERETVRRAANLLEWHPEGLRLAAGMAREQKSGWEGVLAFLEEEGLKGGQWDPLRRLLERQWQRMGAEKREWVERLVWQTARGGPLQEPLAAAIWDVKLEVAHLMLRDLERTGLVERVALHPAEWWHPPEAEMWRVAPLVFRLRREADQRGTWKKDQQRWRRKVVFRGDWTGGYSAPPMPRSLALVATLFHILGALVKVPIGVAVALLAWLTGRKDWSQRWRQWTTVLTPITNLRWHLERREIRMAEELELLISRSNRMAGSLAWAELGVLVALPWIPLGPYRWLLLVPCMVAANLLLAWFTWLSVLYGVRTWDLALMVRLALALTRPLQWLEPVRREGERLQEACTWGHDSS